MLKILAQKQVCYKNVIKLQKCFSNWYHEQTNNIDFCSLYFLFLLKYIYNETLYLGVWSDYRIHRKRLFLVSLFKYNCQKGNFIWILQNFWKHIFYRTLLKPCIARPKWGELPIKRSVKWSNNLKKTCNHEKLFIRYSSVKHLRLVSEKFHYTHNT